MRRWPCVLWRDVCGITKKRCSAALACQWREKTSVSGDTRDPGMKALVKRLEGDPSFMKDFIGCLSNDGKLRFANSILGEQRPDGSQLIDVIAGRHRRAITVREVSMSVGKEIASKAGVADQNEDGIVSSTELDEWLRNLQRVAASQRTTRRKEATNSQLMQLALISGIPFIGFGFLDNSIMLIAGETIELNLGYMLGISTLACAALGNLVSDIFGLGANSFIEATARKLGLKDPKLTVYQLGTRRVKLVQLIAASIGVTIGCLIGMFPLLFMDTKGPDEHSERGSAEKEKVISTNLSAA